MHPHPRAPGHTRRRPCADFRTQAAAQNAHNTRDADGDGDGVYCEDVPCPCLEPKQTGSTQRSTRKTSRPRLGRSIPLATVRKHSDCRVRGPLPDLDCTPGARYHYATKAKVCRSGYSSAVRNVSDQAKDALYSAYAMTSHMNGRNGEVDHVVSLELGGSNSRANLFPEAATPRPGSHEKDSLGNRLHDEVCSGSLTLRRAQGLIATDWLAAYHARFG
jgi:hypothetical protein